MAPLGRISAEVDLAALMEAQVALGADSEEDLAAIADLLGFQWLSVRAARQSQFQAPPSNVVSTRRKLPESSHSGRALDKVSPRLVEPQTATGEQLEWTISESELAPVEALPITRPGLDEGAPDHLPLIEGHWFRGLVTLLLAQDEPSNVLDWKSIERTLLRGAPLLELPWQHRPSLRRGVELWVDISESMDPYRRDEVEFVGALRAVIGKEAVRVRYFELDVNATSDEQVVWEVAEPTEFVQRTPVLVISDFGLSRLAARDQRPASGRALLSWTKRARDRGCRTLGLIPAPKSTWPAGLSEAIVGYEWDRTLSTRTLRSSAQTRADRRIV